MFSRTSLRCLFHLLMAFIGACSAATALYKPEISRHADVIDGATLNLGIPGYTFIRLEGLDAPEANFVCTRAGQPWNCGQEAKEFLAKEIGSSAVSCKPVGVDAQQNTVARCWIYVEATMIAPDHHGRNLSEQMLAHGYALPMLPTPPAFAQAAALARNAHLGLWAADNLKIRP